MRIMICNLIKRKKSSFTYEKKYFILLANIEQGEVDKKSIFVSSEIKHL